MGAQQDSKKVSISSSNPVVISNNSPVSEPSGKLYVAVVVSLLGAVGLGLVIGYLSPVIDKISNDKVDIVARSWYGSAMPLGALFGGIFAPVLIKFLGKKMALISHGLPFTLGWACFVADFTDGHELFYVGRALTGFSCGLVCGTAPGYVSEISTANKRGLLGSCFQLFITIGILIAALIGNPLDRKVFAIICAIPSILMSVLMVFMPESPVQILSQFPLNDQTVQRAENELRKLRSPDSQIGAELEMLVSAQKQMNDMGHESFSQKVNKVDFYKPLIFSLLLMLIQQMSGVNAILFYTNSIFQGVSPDMNLIVAGAALTGTQVLATGAEILVVERLGRRLLLVLSSCGCALSLGVMAAFYILKEKNMADDLSWLPLVTLVFFIICFSMGLAPIPWLMVPELTPANHRTLISGIATAFNWFIAFLVTWSFEPLVAIMKEYGAYGIFMAFQIVGVALLLIFLPETGGRNIDEVVKKYSHGWRNSLFLATASKKDSVAIEERIQNQANQSYQNPENSNV